MKSRRHIYIEESLTKRLQQLAAKPGSSRSAIVSDAVRAYLERQGADELDDRFKVRLDKIGQQLSRIERDVGIVMESLALFVRYQFMTGSPLPESEQAAARGVGQDRFQAFIEQVGRRLANGKSLRTEMMTSKENGHDR